MLHLAFIDDSGQRNPPRQGLERLVSLGSIVVSDRELAGLAADLRSIREELGLPDDEEIKWKPPNGSFLASAGQQLVEALRQRMLQAAIDHGVRSVVVVVDHGSVYQSQSEVEVGTTMLRWLYERISMCLAERDDVGMVIADKPGGGRAQERRWLAETRELTNDGTEYVTPDRIVLPIVTADSHHVPNLQLADLVVAASTAAVAGVKAGLKLKPWLQQLLHHNRLGDAGGAGIVIWPPQPNLFYWAFGEECWSKPSTNSGYMLPWHEWRYAADDGLR